MTNTALLVVDMQAALAKYNPWRLDTVVENIGDLLTACRARNIGVIYVRHDDGPGGQLEKGTPGWQIVDRLTPGEGEAVFDKQRNSAFLGTGLEEYLRGKGIGTIILTGMQTEYCIDVTCKGAVERGLALIVPQDANTTFDNEYLPAERLHAFFNRKIWAGRFAEVVETEALLKRLREK